VVEYQPNLAVHDEMVFSTSYIPHIGQLGKKQGHLGKKTISTSHRLLAQSISQDATAGTCPGSSPAASQDAATGSTCPGPCVAATLTCPAPRRLPRRTPPASQKPALADAAAELICPAPRPPSVDLPRPHAACPRLLPAASRSLPAPHDTARLPSSPPRRGSTPTFPAQRRPRSARPNSQ
jgi:hypothetical protein